MPHVSVRRLVLQWVLPSLLTLVTQGALAQATPKAPETDWRRANEAVGQFKRGHIDLLKWEASRVGEEAQAAPAVAGLMLATAQDAVRQAWRAHPDLAVTQSQLGPDRLALIAEGRWTELSPAWSRRLDEMGELLEVAADARKAWLKAVAAAQVLGERQAQFDNAEAARELGKRMVSVGNWSAREGLPVQLEQASARMDLRRARVAELQAQRDLLQSLRLSDRYTRVGLPEALASVPSQPMEATVWAQRLAALKAQLPAADARRGEVSARMAFEVYQAALALAQDSAEVLKLREQIAEDAGLRYNGMLASVWDLLGDLRSQTQARIEAIEARRDFWLAESDLQWVLQGGLPAGLVALGGGAEAGTDAAGGH